MTRWLSLALAAAGLILAARADACGTAGPPGVRVEIADEAAVIVWDAEGKIEHFIRRANFVTEADDIGFVVPTPGKPELEEVDHGIFAALEQHTAPRLVEGAKRIPALPIGCGGGFRGAPGVSAGRVEVVSEKVLAGQRATVLAADDAGALRRWLQSKGYPVTDALQTWAESYVKKGWYFTAFRYVKSPKERAIDAKAVRMSFAADAPFYPYKEPLPAAGTKPTVSRTLKVFVISDSKVEGVQDDTGEAWAGATEFAKPVEAATVRDWHTRLKLDAATSRVWLTEMIDRSSPRPAAGDVEFRPALDGAEKERPPTVWHGEYDPAAFYGGLVLVAAVIGLWCLTRPASRRGVSP